MKYIFLLLLILVFFPCCKKPVDDWNFCNGCPEHAWIGNFSGNSEYYDIVHDNGIVKHLPVNLTVDSVLNQTLKIHISSPQEFSWQFTGTKSDNAYYFSIVSSSQLINLNLYKKGDAYKLTGTAKKYHTLQSDSIIIDASMSFEVYKTKQ